MEKLLPIAVAALCTGACVVYVCTGNWRSAIVWGGFAIADWALSVLITSV